MKSQWPSPHETSDYNHQFSPRSPASGATPCSAALVHPLFRSEGVVFADRRVELSRAAAPARQDHHRRLDTILRADPPVRLRGARPSRRPSRWVYPDLRHTISETTAGSPAPAGLRRVNHAHRHSWVSARSLGEWQRRERRPQRFLEPAFH